MKTKTISKEYDRIHTEVLSSFFSTLRKEKKYTREEISKNIGVKQPTYTCYEIGSRTCPLSVFKKLCEFYGIGYYDTFIKLDQEVERKMSNE